jgi:hypothetical protein
MNLYMVSSINVSPDKFTMSGHELEIASNLRIRGTKDLSPIFGAFVGEENEAIKYYRNAVRSYLSGCALHAKFNYDVWTFDLDFEKIDPDGHICNVVPTCSNGATTRILVGKVKE